MFTYLQIAPIYLTSCMKQGMGLLENLLCRQSVQRNDMLLKVTDNCFILLFVILCLTHHILMILCIFYNIFVSDGQIILIHAEH